MGVHLKTEDSEIATWPFHQTVIEEGENFPGRQRIAQLMTITLTDGVHTGTRQLTKQLTK